MIGLIPTLAIAAAGAGAGLWFWRLRQKEDSRRIDQPLAEVVGGDAAAWDDSEAVSWMVGIPYHYAKGGPATTRAEAEEGLDCSGAGQVALVAMGELAASYPDRTATQLANDCDPIPAGEQRPGDLAIYPQHVAVVISFPDEQGDSAVLSASGGDSTTLGNDPNAYIRVFSTALYRDDFICFGRLKADKRGL